MVSAYATFSSVDSKKYQLPEPFKPPRGPDWQRVARWCGLGALAMFIWLLYPTADCSWQKFRDLPQLSSFDDHQLDVWRADKERLDRAETFGDRWLVACKMCYRRTPVLGQSAWKSNALILLLLGWLGATGASIHYRRRRQTFGS